MAAGPTCRYVSIIAPRSHMLPERAADPLFDAALGLRVRRPTYVKCAQIEERTATRA